MTVYWDVTPRCNAACLYCSAAQARARQPVEEASPGSALLALERLRIAGVDRIIFLGGEPTLREDLSALIPAALHCGLDVGIATNGLALREELRHVLLGYERVSINVSLDSFFADENDAVRGAGHCERALQTLRMLLSARRSCGAPLRVTVQVTLTRANLQRLEESLPRLLELGIDGLLLERMRRYSWQPSAVRRLAPGPGEWIAGAMRAAQAAMQCDDGARIVVNYGHARLRALLGERYGLAARPEHICPGGWQVAVLTAEGFLHPCRAVLERPIPRDENGEPRFAIDSLRADQPGAGDFRQSSYFVDFFNFAHSARTYDGLPMCRSCPHYEECEPCPLDVATYGPRVLAECIALESGRVPEYA